MKDISDFMSVYGILLIPTILIIVFTIDCFWEKQSVEVDKLIELMILGGALNYIWAMYRDAIAFCKIDHEKALVHFIGATATLFVTCYGVKKIFKSIKPQYKPHYAPKPE